MEGGAYTTPNDVIDTSTWRGYSNGSSASKSCNTIGHAVDSEVQLNQSEQSSSHDRGLEDRKRAIWDDMRMRMENRRKDWNVEVERLRRDFFKSKPSSGTSVREAGAGDGTSLERLKSTGSEEENKFRVCFDLSAFHPNEISVRTEERKLIVSARHEEKSPDQKRTATREFNRQIDIPRNVQLDAMRCTLTRDGILQVEADVLSRRSSLDSTTGVLPQKSSPCTHAHTAPSTKIVEPEPKTLFTISVNVGKDFEPGDLTVKTVDRKLVVSARRQTECPGNTTTKEFHREFDLPDAVDPVMVTANMTAEGCLLIEAPLPLPAKTTDCDSR